MTTWHENDEFWEIWGESMFWRNSEIWKKAEEEVDLIISLLEIKPDQKILDLCCGPGRHSLEFTRRGFHIVGVDRTKAYLEEAKRRAEEEKLTIEFILEDMRKFHQPNGFDVILNLFTSFSYFKDPEDDKRVLENVYSSLRPEGKFIIEMHGKETLSRIFQERDWEEHNGTFMLYERKVSNNWSWMENRWIMIKDGQVREWKVPHRLYSGKELASLLDEVGFQDVRTYGDFIGSPYDHKAKRLIAVAIK